MNGIGNGMFPPITHRLTTQFCYYRKAPRICFCWIWVGRGKQFSLISTWLVLLLSLVTKGAPLHFLGLPYKLLQTLWLKNQKFILIAWRLEVWNQGISRAMSFWRIFPWLFLGVLGSLGLITASLQSLPLSPHGPFHCMYLSASSLLVRTLVIGIRIHPNSVWSQLITFTKALFLNRITSWGLDRPEIWGDLSNPLQCLGDDSYKEPGSSGWRKAHQAWLKFPLV